MTFVDWFQFALMAAVFVALVGVARRQFRWALEHRHLSRGGVLVEAEILDRFVAGAPLDSDRAKRRESRLAPWDPLEVEARYQFGGATVTSRRRVTSSTFYRVRRASHLKIRVSPQHPEMWTAAE